MDWTAGYSSDMEYTAGFYREQSPAYLNFVCILNGFEPIPIDRPFTYFELGFGRGLTANLLAASSPHGQFYAADFNPGHVAGARQVADAAQLDNLILLENSFDELANGQVKGLPQFDFITLHGIYSWVTEENRQHITNFINRNLKPGGIVYISYNAMPGWAPSLPLQRLMVEHADLFPNRSDEQIKGAAKFLEKMELLQAGYLVANPAMKVRLDTLKTANTNYLVHEYMHKHWQPMYHADVARDMTRAKLDYVGSAELPYSYVGLFLSPERQTLINTLPNSTMRETMKDYFLNTSFRKDVFVRGARRINGLRQAELLSQIGLALLVPRESVSMKMKLVVGEVNAREEAYGPVLDAIAQHPMTLGELYALPAVQAQGEKGLYGSLAQIAAILTASNQTAMYFNSYSVVATDAAHRLNRVLADHVRYSDDYQALCSPLLANGLSANYMERVVYTMLKNGGHETAPALIVKQVWQTMATQGRRMLKEGKVLDTEAENITELEAQIRSILAHKLPLWRQLKMI